jgi:predicted RNase H-like nuclease (RuvC/YqgF family)
MIYFVAFNLLSYNIYKKTTCHSNCYLQTKSRVEGLPMAKIVTTADSSATVKQLTTENFKFKETIRKLESKIAKMEIQAEKMAVKHERVALVSDKQKAKLEKKIVELQTQIKNRETPPDISPVDLSKYRNK